MQNTLASEPTGFRINHDFEYAILEWPSGSLALGDHYGDPTCALVCPEHGWCVVGGEGIVVFDFGGSFSLDNPPSLEKCTPASLWRRAKPPPDSTACWFVSELTAVDADHVRAVVDQHGSFEVNLRTLSWRAL